jgi:hypothetical protein
MSVESRLQQFWKDHPDAKKCYQVLNEFFADVKTAGSYLRGKNAMKITEHSRPDDKKEKSEPIK